MDMRPWPQALHSFFLTVNVLLISGAGKKHYAPRFVKMNFGKPMRISTSVTHRSGDHAAKY